MWVWEISWGHRTRRTRNLQTSAAFNPGDRTVFANVLSLFGVPTGVRTPVAAVKGRCPRPLDDGDLDNATDATQNCRAGQVLSRAPRGTVWLPMHSPAGGLRLD